MPFDWKWNSRKIANVRFLFTQCCINFINIGLCSIYSISSIEKSTFSVFHFDKKDFLFFCNFFQIVNKVKFLSVVLLVCLNTLEILNYTNNVLFSLAAICINMHLTILFICIEVHDIILKIKKILSIDFYIKLFVVFFNFLFFYLLLL